MQQEYQKLDLKIIKLKKELSSMPNGKLVCSKNNNRYKWYQSNGHEKIYIPKRNLKLAQQLATKKYLSLLLEDLEKEKYAIQLYLNHCSGETKKSIEFLVQDSEYKTLLNSSFSPVSEELSTWCNAYYEQNPKAHEQLIHKSSSRNLLRSKSEAIIDTFLYTNQIPFRYECPLQLNDITLYPDFTIRHPKTGQFFYWEHFGLMDNPNYIKNAYSKLQLYTTNGIIPSINLITTYETKEYPLSIDIVEKIIAYYFL